MSTAFNSGFGNEFAQLTPDQQHQVVEFVRQLKTQQSTEQQRRQAILKFAGSIPKDDIERMKAAIEEGCGRVDADGW